MIKMILAIITAAGLGALPPHYVNQPRVTEPLAPGGGYTAMLGVIQPPTVAAEGDT
jgi:hypothetical protein